MLNLHLQTGGQMKKLFALALLAASAAHADPVEYRFWMAADCDAAPALCSPVDIPGKLVVDALPGVGVQTFDSGAGLLRLDFGLNDQGIGSTNLDTLQPDGGDPFPALVSFMDGVLTDIHFKLRVSGAPGTIAERFFEVSGLHASWAGQNVWNIVRVQQVAAVPEPDTYALLLLGLGLMTARGCGNLGRGRSRFR
jgi:hypothetical protein